MQNTLLFQPFHLASLTLPNRIIMAPMETNLAGPNGEVTTEMIAYYAERAAGGAGMITVEFTCVDRDDGLACTPQLSLDSPSLIAGHSRLVAAIRAEGALACLQLHHAGRQTTPAILNGHQPIGPSEFNSPVYRMGPRAMEQADIQRLIKRFAQAASYAYSAGYDAIELHGAHGYLLGQFLSPWTNQRTDEWGGDFNRRLAFPLAVIEAVKKRIGTLPLIYRFSADEMVEGGLGIEDTVRIAPHLVQAGIDALHVSTGVAERIDANVEPIHYKDGWRLPLARRIREVVTVPVIGVGVIRTPDMALEAISRGDTDLIALGRALLADPLWPNKAKAGHSERIRPCTSCNWCIDQLARNRSIGCAENPHTGRELAGKLQDIRERENAVVIGAGPAGMFAALALDQAGFTTILYEKRDVLGGGLIASATPPGKAKLFRYRDYLAKQLERSTVDLRLNHAPSSTEIIEHKPSITVIATGAVPRHADIPGVHLPHVSEAYDVVMNEVRIGDGPIAVLGGGETGCEVAELAAEHGADVVLISRSDVKKLARSAEAIYRRHLIKKLQKNPRITIISSVNILKITDEEVHVRHRDGTHQSVPAAQVFSALGRDTGSRLAIELNTCGIKTAVIGDARNISRIGEAVHDAYHSVRRHVRELNAKQTLY